MDTELITIPEMFSIMLWDYFWFWLVTETISALPFILFIGVVGTVIYRISLSVKEFERRNK